MDYLKKNSMYLKIMANKSSKDDGMDLLGRWTFPKRRIVFEVVAQCKDEQKKCSSSHVRELGGIVSGILGHETDVDYEDRHETNRLVGMLLHSKGFSEASVQAATLCKAPLMLVTLNEEEGLQSIYLNDVLKRDFPLNVGFALGQKSPRKSILLYKATKILH